MVPPPFIFGGDFCRDDLPGKGRGLGKSVGTSRERDDDSFHRFVGDCHVFAGFFPICSAQSFFLDGGAGPLSFHLRLYARDRHGDRLKRALWIRGFLQIAPAEVEGASGAVYLFHYGFFHYHLNSSRLRRAPLHHESNFRFSSRDDGLVLYCFTCRWNPDADSPSFAIHHRRPFQMALNLFAKHKAELHS
jgi:hypothetical protein